MSADNSSVVDDHLDSALIVYAGSSDMNVDAKQGRGVSGCFGEEKARCRVHGRWLDRTVNGHSAGQAQSVTSVRREAAPKLVRSKLGVFPLAVLPFNA